MSYSDEEIRAEGLHLFRNFMRHVWKHLGLPVPTPVQLSIADTIQFAPELLENGDRLIIQAFRGVGKSWITAAFALWTLFLDSQKKIMVVSASQPLADNFSIFCKSLVAEMPLLAHLRPRESQRTSNLAWDVGAAKPDPAPSMKSAGITGQITGSRADLIIPDDIEIPKNSYTHVLRERLAELVKEFDAVLKPGGRVLYLGTPQNEQSIYPKLEKRGYVTRIWPADIPEDLDRYKGRLSPHIVSLIEHGAKPLDPVDPQRFDEADLLKRKASYGVAGYALQFRLDTSPSDVDAHPLKLRDLIVYDTDLQRGPVGLSWGGSRELVVEGLLAGGFDGDLYHRPAWRSEHMTEWQGTVMAIDPSGKGKDETAYAIVRLLNGLLYLVDVGGFKDGYAESTLGGIAAAGARHGVNHVVIEENFGGGMFGQLLKPHLLRHGAGRIDDEYNGWSHTQKETRICDTLQPVMESHRLVVDSRVLQKDLIVQADTEAYSFVYQLTRMKRQKDALAHEDRCEAVSMAVSYWTEKMARDQQTIVNEHQEELERADLERFMANVFDPGNVFTPKEMLWHKR